MKLRLPLACLTALAALASCATDDKTAGTGADLTRADSAVATPPPARPDATKQSTIPDTSRVNKLGADADADTKAEALPPKAMGLADPPANRAPDTDPDPDPNEFVAVEFEPAPLNLDAVRRAIQYPPEAKAAGIGGKVALKILIDKEGYYKRHVVRTTPDQRLTDAVVQVVRKIRYSPARNAGQPVKVWVNFEYDFKP